MEAQSELGPKDSIVIDLGEFPPLEQKVIRSLHGFTDQEKIKRQGIDETLEMAGQARKHIEELLKPEAAYSAEDVKRVLHITLGHIEAFQQRHDNKTSQKTETPEKVLSNTSFILDRWVSRPALTALTGVDCSQGPILLNLPQTSS